MEYDYLIVGSGLFGATCAHELKKVGKSSLILEKRNHIGGNIYTENIESIQVHKYGAHIFHTNNKMTWAYINQFAVFNNYVNSPLANYNDMIYNLPFNMNTFYQMWGKIKPFEVAAILERQRAEIKGEPRNLEEQAISLVGRDIYEKLIKGYTEKQWGRPCNMLPPSIIKRLPVRMTYNNNYFDDNYQGIPIGGYTQIIEKMLIGSDIRLNVDYLKDRERWNDMANRVIYTGPIDAYFRYCYGPLAYRCVRFETEVKETDNYQGNAVVNYTEAEIPYTRIIEHKHFEYGTQTNTVVSWEFSEEWTIEKEPYYPVNDVENEAIYKKYRVLTDIENKTVFGGRLGEYKYYNMDQVIEAALELVAHELKD